MQQPDATETKSTYNCESALLLLCKNVYKHVNRLNCVTLLANAWDLAAFWCNPGHVTMKDHLCTPDVKLLDMGFLVRVHLWYLPLHVIMFVIIYIRAIGRQTESGVIPSQSSQGATFLSDIFSLGINEVFFIFLCPYIETKQKYCYVLFLSNW